MSSILRHICLTGAALLILSTALSSCFTGVESTPKIKNDEARKQGITGGTDEERFLADVRPQPVKDWSKGKKFYITDSKVAVLFTQPFTERALGEGSELTFDTIIPAPSVTGRGASNVRFLTAKGDTLNYRLEIARDELMKREKLLVPFTIENYVVERVRDKILGKTLYINVPTWLPAGLQLSQGEYVPSVSRYVKGLRHTPVKITAVEPGNDAYPVCVYFKDTTGEFPDETFRIYMTAGSDNIATRNFETLFSFENVRKKYPLISDHIWDLIIHSKLEPGMTREECRLALGSPSDNIKYATTKAMVERWIYDSGVYLIFEDGVLTAFRQ